MAEPLSRRERTRVETVREIKDTARRVLVEQGVEGLALRAIAREMGMTAPALYRYFSSREDLLEHVVADLYGELCDVLDAARDAVVPAEVAARLIAASRAFRTWATTHTAEFGLLFGSPADSLVAMHPQPADEDRSPAQAAAHRFGQIFGELVSQLYLERGFPIPRDDELDPALRDQLSDWCDTFPTRLPLGVVYVFLSCWIRLYGIVSMEVFGHLRFALQDAAPMFEAELRELSVVLGFAGELPEA